MKRAGPLLLLLMLCLVSGCTFDETDAAYPFPNDPTPDFSCTVNEHPWVADSAFFTFSGNLIVITAYRGGNPCIRLSITGSSSGVYPILQGTNDLVYNPTPQTESTATNGDIVVSDFEAQEGKITGSFDHINATGTAGWFSITDGYFISIRHKSQRPY